MEKVADSTRAVLREVLRWMDSPEPSATQLIEIAGPWIEEGSPNLSMVPPVAPPSLMTRAGWLIDAFDLQRDNHRSQLIRLIAKSDPQNFERHRAGFPVECALVDAYRRMDRELGIALRELREKRGIR